MAQVKKITYGAAGWTPDAAQGKAFFDSFNCPIIETELLDPEVFTVNIDNTVLLTFDGRSANRIITATIDGVTTTIGANQTYQTYGQKTFIVACSENFFYMDLHGYSSYLYVCYEKVEGSKLWGYVNENNSSRLLNDITLSDLDTSTQYKHGARLGYGVQPGYLDYASDVLFNSAGTQKEAEDPNFVAITSVTAKQVLTFDSKNYYALSANVCALLDD